MKMNKILVTGGAGYIGSHTVSELVRQGFPVVVLDDLRSGYKQLLPAEVLVEEVSLEDKDKVFEVFKKHQPDAVIDFAAYLAVGESMIEPEKYFQNNVSNFINILDAMFAFGCKCIVKSSTAAVYGNPTKESDVPWRETSTESYKPEISALLEGNWGTEKISGEAFMQKFIAKYEEITENRPGLELNDVDIYKLRIPLSIYGLSKLIDEIILEKYNKLSGTKYVAFRYFNVCGADSQGRTGDSKPKPTNLMSLAILSAQGKIPELSIFGKDYPTKDGTGVRDYIHPSDLATAHVAALDYLGKDNHSDIFNLARGQGSTVFEVIKAVELASGKQVKYKIEERRAGDASISIADPSKAEKALEWKAKYNLSDMAKTAWSWEDNFKKKILK